MGNKVIQLLNTKNTKRRSTEDMTPENDHQRLSENLGITPEEAEEMVYKFYVTYPAAVEWARMKINPGNKMR